MNCYNEICKRVKDYYKNIESFMNHLGLPFCFIGREQKIKIVDKYNDIDNNLIND